MARKYLDCREYPGKKPCSLTLVADDEDELVEAVVEHGKKVHGYDDSPQFRSQVRSMIKEGEPRP